MPDRSRDTPVPDPRDVDLDDPLSVRARDVLFAHWPVAPDALAAHVPDPLSVATHAGSAWLGVVALEVTGVRLGPLPDVTTPFLQVNFRTYVRHDGDLGVYFCSLDCASPAAAAAGRAGWALPFHAADGRADRHGGTVTYRSRRRGTPADEDGERRPVARFDARFAPAGDPSPVDPDSLADFLVERHRYFVPGEDGLLVGEIARDPWQVCDADAEVRTNTLAAAAGIDAALGTPEVHYSPRFESRTGRAHPVSGGWR